MFGEVLKNFENITRNFEENFEKTKSKFWKNSLNENSILRDSRGKYVTPECEVYGGRQSRAP